MSIIHSFVSPLTSTDIRVDAKFSYIWDETNLPDPPSTMCPYGVIFSKRGANNLSIRTVFNGRIMISPNDLFNIDINNIRDELNMPTPPNSYNENQCIDLFLIPCAPLTISRINYKLSLTAFRGHIIGVRYSNIKIKSISIKDNTSPIKTLGNLRKNKNNVIQKSDGNVIKYDVIDPEWYYFFDGQYSIQVDGGCEIANINDNSTVAVSILTTEGYIDPMEFFDLIKDICIMNDAEMNTLRDLFPYYDKRFLDWGNEAIPGTEPRIQELINLNRFGYYFTPALFNVIARQCRNNIADPLVTRTFYQEIAGDFDDNVNVNRPGQKERFIRSLHEIGMSNETDYAYSAIIPTRNPYADTLVDGDTYYKKYYKRSNWFDNTDWQNIFQLEALCEFYLNFRTPFSGSAPLRPRDLNYRKVDFDSENITSILTNEVSPTIGSGSGMNPNYIPNSTYPKLEFPYIIVLIDDITHIGGDLIDGEGSLNNFPTQPPGSPDRDRYKGVLFLIERFQNIENGIPAGFPRIIGKYPWSSHASQTGKVGTDIHTDEDRSSIAGNHLYVFFSRKSKGMEWINYAFLLGNSYLPNPLPNPTGYIRWGYSSNINTVPTCTQGLPGIFHPLANTLNPREGSTVDQNGKGAIFLHRGNFSGISWNASKGCLVSSRVQYCNFKEFILNDFLNKYDPFNNEPDYAFFRRMRDDSPTTPSVPPDTSLEQWCINQWNNDVSDITQAQWCSDPASTKKLRGLLFLIRPNEPTV